MTLSVQAGQNQGSLRAHLKQVERQTGRTLPELHVAKPEAVMYLWKWFLELNHTRVGYNAIPYTELYHFMEVRNLSLSQWEIDALLALDALWLRTYHG